MHVPSDCGLESVDKVVVVPFLAVVVPVVVPFQVAAVVVLVCGFVLSLCCYGLVSL